MLIILKESIKGKGKVDEIKDFANGYANFLIKEGKAVPATKENLDELKVRLQNLVEQDIKDTHLANNTKQYLENLTLTFKQKALPDGSTKNSITKKDVANELAKIVNKGETALCNIEEIRMKPIKQFGTHDIEIKLYRNIKALLKIKIEIV